jgi:hypothetical protein
LQSITIIPETLAIFVEEPSLPQAFDLSGNWQGTLLRMKPDCIEFPPVTTSWTRLEDLGEDYHILYFPHGVSVSCPRQIESGKEFVLAVDWLVNSSKLQRGIRNFDTSGFTSFTLPTFTLIDEKKLDS